MLYLTFRPAKGSVLIPKLVKCLSIAIDAFFILLMAWTVVNLCHPFWGWHIYLSIWLGFFSLFPLYWLNGHLSLRSFKTAEYRHNDLNFTDAGRLKHLGFLFSVWHHPDALTLGYYHKNDKLACRKERIVMLGYEIALSKWLGWPIVLVTDTIPLILLAAMFSAGYFLGIGTLIFYLMGLALALNLITIPGRLQNFYLWEDAMFFEGKIYPKRYVGILTCILEGSDGELVLTMIDVAMFHHFAKREWYLTVVETACSCCFSMADPMVAGYHRIYRQHNV